MDRFSRRDGDESFSELERIAKAGVQDWFYSDGSRFQYRGFASNTLSFLKGEFAAEYRRAISQKTHEAHLRKAGLGPVTGGRVFGYDNVKVDEHVERRVNHAVLKTIAGDVLRPAVVSAIIDSFLRQLLPANIESRVDALWRELRVLDAKIQNLTAAIEQGGGSLPSVLALLSERQKQRDALLAEIGSAETRHQIHLDRAAIEVKVQRAVADWRGC